MQKYSSLWHNPAIFIGKKACILEAAAFEWTHAIGDLYKDGKLISYGDLTCQFNLEGEQNFWKYLQIGNCILKNLGTQRIIFWII